MLKKIYHNNNLLINGLYVVGFVIFVIGSLILRIIFGDQVPETYYMIITLILPICAIISSIFVIIRKEVPKPGFKGLRGTAAVVIGVILLFIWGIGGIALIILIFNPSAF